jgi:hypothetical protein
MAYIYGFTLTVTDVQEESISLELAMGNQGEAYQTVQLTAQKDGDGYRFETEGLAGSLEFGVSCIWLHVTDSSVDIPGEGSHLLDYKTEE